MPDRADRANWPALRALFAAAFREKDRCEWEHVFDGSDACVTPVKTHAELRAEGYAQRPFVALHASPARADAAERDGWEGAALAPGEGGAAALEEWWGLREGVAWVRGAAGVQLLGEPAKAKL